MIFYMVYMIFSQLPNKEVHQCSTCHTNTTTKGDHQCSTDVTQKREKKGGGGGAHQCSTDVTQTQQQRPESPTPGMRIKQSRQTCFQTGVRDVTRIYKVANVVHRNWSENQYCNQSDTAIDRLIDVRLYSAILRSLEQTHCARMWFYMGDQLYSAFL